MEVKGNKSTFETLYIPLCTSTDQSGTFYADCACFIRTFKSMLCF